MSDGNTPSTFKSGPLDGLRVIDLTQALAGPYATMLLADLGADVVKIESPEGDMTRDSSPHLTDDEAYGGFFHSVNRNKRSIVLDLKVDAEVDALKHLVKSADVVVENFRAGIMERLGLSYEHLSESNPGLIYASIRGFGDPRTDKSPYADRPSFDPIAQAMGGIMSITGTPESGPVKVGPGIGDIFPASIAVVGILSALWTRQYTGEGQYVDVSMVDSILSLSERIVHQYAFEGDVPEPQGNSHPIWFPFDRFNAKDGYVVIAAPGDHQWAALCEHMERSDLASIPNEERSHRAEELKPIVNKWTGKHNKQELFDMLAHDVPCGPIDTAADIFESKHFAARKMLPEVEHADTGERVRIAGTPVKFTGTPAREYRRAPFLGEHTREVLMEAGYSDAAIADIEDSS